jgi:hypothetical protein
MRLCSYAIFGSKTQYIPESRFISRLLWILDWLVPMWMYAHVGGVAET